MSSDKRIGDIQNSHLARENLLDGILDSYCVRMFVELDIMKMGEVLLGNSAILQLQFEKPFGKEDQGDNKIYIGAALALRPGGGVPEGQQRVDAVDIRPITIFEREIPLRKSCCIFEVKLRGNLRIPVGLLVDALVEKGLNIYKCPEFGEPYCGFQDHISMMLREFEQQKFITSAIIGWLVPIGVEAPTNISTYEVLERVWTGQDFLKLPPREERQLGECNIGTK